MKRRAFVMVAAALCAAGVVCGAMGASRPTGSVRRLEMIALPVRGICAHQGDCQFFPGNTAEALESAARKGAAMVEFDVQRCKTGEFVLMHDATIDRLTTGTGRICDHTLEELKSYTYRRFPEKACRIATLDEALDVLPNDGILINVHCYAGSGNMEAIVRKLKERGRLHQAFVTARLNDIDLARKAAPEVAANNIERPGPRNRDWTPQENAKFVSDAIAHRCQYLQLSRPWPRQYSDAAHAGGVKVILFHSDKPSELKDLMVERGIDFVMTNRLTPMLEAFKALGLSTVETDPISYVAHQGEEALAPSHSKAAYRLAVEHGLDYMKLDVRETKDGQVVTQHDATLKSTMGWDVPIRKVTLAEILEKGRCKPRGGYTNETITTLQEALEISKGMRKGVWIDFKDFNPKFAEKVFGLLDAAGYGADRVIVATFNKSALKWARENRPAVRRVAHTFIKSLPEGGFKTNAGDPDKDRVYPTVDALGDALEAHAKELGLYGFNLPHVFRNGKPLYKTPPELLKRLRGDGYWISIWFAYDADTAELYRKVGVDAFVTNCKANTFPSARQKAAVKGRDKEKESDDER
jgi:glycerophosphoryl diester phosphodiesterase